MLDSKPDQYIVVEQPIETTIVKNWVDVTSNSKAKKKALNPDNWAHLIRKDRGKPSNKQTSTS